MTINQIKIFHLGLCVVLLAGIFVIGSLSPLELVPQNVSKMIGIHTVWSSASPTQIEAEIVTQQENVLANIRGLKRIESKISFAHANVVLFLNDDVDMGSKYLDTLQALARIRAQPPDAQRPRIIMGGTPDPANVVSSLYVTKQAGFPHTATNQKFVIDHIIKPINRLEGVDWVEILDPRTPTVDVRLNQEELVQTGTSIRQVISALSHKTKHTPSSTVLENEVFSVRRDIPNKLTDFGNIFFA